MPNRKYIKGKKFEWEIKKHLESFGYTVIMAGGSKFPDGMAARKFEIVFPKIFIYECKNWNPKKHISKYLNKKEEKEADTIKLKTGLPFLVFYKEDHKIRWYEYDSNNSKE